MWYLAGAAVLPVAVFCFYLTAACEYRREEDGFLERAEKIEKLLQSEEVKAGRETVTGRLGTTELLARYRETMERAMDSMALHKTPGTVETGLLLNAREEKVEVREVSFAKRQLSFVGITENYKEISLFIKRLKESGLADNLTYTGFSANDEGKYEFRVTFTMGE